MNRGVPRLITSEQIETFDRDGVLCLLQMFDADWVESRVGA